MAILETLKLLVGQVVSGFTPANARLLVTWRRLLIAVYQHSGVGG